MDICHAKIRLDCFGNMNPADPDPLLIALARFLQLVYPRCHSHCRIATSLYPFPFQHQYLASTYRSSTVTPTTALVPFSLSLDPAHRPSTSPTAQLGPIPHKKAVSRLPRCSGRSRRNPSRIEAEETSPTLYTIRLSCSRSRSSPERKHRPPKATSLGIRPPEQLLNNVFILYGRP